MNSDLFFQYIKRTRDCDAGLLDIALQKGINRAKSDSLDFKKLFKLAAASVITAALCFTVNTAPVKEAIGYFRNSSRIPQSSTEALDIYTKDMANTIIKYLGDG